MSDNQISPEEVLKRNRETAIKATLHDFQVLMDNIGAEAVLNAMPGDTYWKLYTHFKLVIGDADPRR